jgi:hypothetical protein
LASNSTNLPTNSLSTKSPSQQPTKVRQNDTAESMPFIIIKGIYPFNPDSIQTASKDTFYSIANCDTKQATNHKGKRYCMFDIPQLYRMK